MQTESWDYTIRYKWSRKQGKEYDVVGRDFYHDRPRDQPEQNLYDFLNDKAAKLVSGHIMLGVDAVSQEAWPSLVLPLAGLHLSEIPMQPGGTFDYRTWDSGRSGYMDARWEVPSLDGCGASLAESYTCKFTERSLWAKANMRMTDSANKIPSEEEWVYTARDGWSKWSEESGWQCNDWFHERPKTRNEWMLHELLYEKAAQLTGAHVVSPVGAAQAGKVFPN